MLIYINELTLPVITTLFTETAKKGVGTIAAHLHHHQQHLLNLPENCGGILFGGIADSASRCKRHFHDHLSCC